MLPSVKKNVAEVAAATKNSATLTEPITNLGLFPRATRVDVTTGPQPPPPTASTNPPTKPRGSNRVCFGVCCAVRIAFTRITAPIINRYTEIHGLMTSPGKLDSTYAPSTPPSTPGRTRRFKNRVSTLPDLKWQKADAAVVNNSAV